MPNRGQTQDQQRKKGKLPGAFTPDGDELAEADPSQTQSPDLQPRRKAREPEPVEEQPEIEDEEAEDDEDEEDGLGARP